MKELEENYRVRLLAACLLKTRLTKTQARKILGRSYVFYKTVLDSMRRSRLIKYTRYSVVTLISLTEQGREWARKVAGGLDPTPVLTRIGALTEDYYTLPELVKKLKVHPSLLYDVLKKTRAGYRLLKDGKFVPSDESLKYRVWIVPKSKLHLVEKALKGG